MMFMVSLFDLKCLCDEMASVTMKTEAWCVFWGPPFWFWKSAAVAGLSVCTLSCTTSIIVPTIVLLVLRDVGTSREIDQSHDTGV